MQDFLRTHGIFYQTWRKTSGVCSGELSLTIYIVKEMHHDISNQHSTPPHPDDSDRHALPDRLCYAESSRWYKSPSDRSAANYRRSFHSSSGIHASGD